MTDTAKSAASGPWLRAYALFGTCLLVFLLVLALLVVAAPSAEAHHRCGHKGVTCPPPPPPPPAACADGLDNDGDSLIDLNDPGCTSTSDTDETNTPSPPPPTTTFHEGFEPNCVFNGVNIWATASWDSPRCGDPAWTVEMHPGYSVMEDGSYALEPSASDYNGSGTRAAFLHNVLPGTTHRVDIRVKPIKWGSTASANCSWAGGPKVYLGRQADALDGTSTYTVELSICEGSAYIQKKSIGVFDCGVDPRAVDCGSGGTWYNLKTVRVPVATFGQWHTYTAIKRDNPDGSVTLIGIRDGVELLRYTEVPGDISLGPLRGGREGWRSNMIDWRMDSFDVATN